MTILKTTDFGFNQLNGGKDEDSIKTLTINVAKKTGNTISIRITRKEIEVITSSYGTRTLTLSLLTEKTSGGGIITTSLS